MFYLSYHKTTDYILGFQKPINLTPDTVSIKFILKLIFFLNNV
jgi:hypothetical protein